MAIESKDQLVWVKAMARGQALPLDASEVWDSLDDAQNYAINSPIAYVGQVLKVKTEDKAEAYIISDSSGRLLKLATVDEDVNTIVNDIIDDTLTIANKAAEAKITGDWLRKLESRFFIGTRAEYEAAYKNKLIAINTIVIITDDEFGDASNEVTTAKLGTAKLGLMVLGNQ